jgi:sulfide:quinone oxidoreductase
MTEETARKSARRHHRVVVAGGGSAGIAVAARLRRAGVADVAVIEPSERHFYQPLWTLVGAGVARKESSVRPQESVMPAGVTWLRDAVRTFLPDESALQTEGGARVEYDYLVVATGIRLRFEAIAGLEAALGKGGVCSNYAYEQCEKTWEALRTFRGGRAIFTMPTPPIKCAGAPQKIAYLADDWLRISGVRDRTEIVYAAATPGIFAVPAYARVLDGVVARKGIRTLFRHELVEIRGERREAVFRDLERGAEVVLPYDVLHAVPPQGPPDCLRASALADAGGFAEVDRASLRHVRYPNVFALGDASSLPTSRTAAAARKQAPVLVANLLAAMRGAEGSARYDGYTACPIPTGYGKLLLAEFDYDLRPAPTFPFLDPTRERWAWYQLKRFGLPALYWHGMLAGRA